MQVASRLNNIGEYYFSKKLREIDMLNKAGKNIISLGIGSPDMPPHPDVIEVLQQQSTLPNVHAYQSYKGSPILRNAIADWYKKWYQVTLDADTEILPLIGSKEGIMHICMTYFEKGTAVLIPNPGYPTYASAVKIAGASAINYHLQVSNNYQPNFTELEIEVAAAAKNGTPIKGMFVNYPHMPTGQLPDIAVLTKLIAFAIQHQILIIHDNPYSFILNDNPFSLLSIEGAKAVVIELNSLSKSHNMAGWRIGMLCGAKDKIDEVLRFKSNMDSGMFLPAQLAAAKALQLGQHWFVQLNTVYAQRRNKVYKLLQLLGCTYSTLQVGMFVWAAIPNGYTDGYALSDEVLYQANVFITPGGIFGTAGLQYIRVSLCSTEENIDAAIQRIEAAKKTM
jgi:aspartate/methionine/tyrosine aminotransferase